MHDHKAIWTCICSFLAKMKVNAREVMIRAKEKNALYRAVNVNDAWILRDGFNAGSHSCASMGEGRIQQGFRKGKSTSWKTPIPLLGDVSAVLRMKLWLRALRFCLKTREYEGFCVLELGAIIPPVDSKDLNDIQDWSLPLQAGEWQYPAIYTISPFPRASIFKES